MTKDMTLREAFGRFHQNNGEIVSETDQTNVANEFFNCHDIAHVVFGCDTSLRGEGLVKLWTIFGTTLGFTNHVKEYSGANAFDLFREYSLKHVVTTVPKVVMIAPVVVARARKMNKKWPWSGYEAYLDVSLDEIRTEFNIVPVDR